MAAYCLSDKTVQKPAIVRSTGGRFPIWNHSTMALNIEDAETEKLATEIAEMTGETEAEAVRQALRERYDRLRLEAGREERPYRSMRQWLETEIWPQIPAELKDRPPRTKAEIEEILGIGPEGP
jgi:antitoxin VapB